MNRQRKNKIRRNRKNRQFKEGEIVGRVTYREGITPPDLSQIGYDVFWSDGSFVTERPSENRNGWWAGNKLVYWGVQEKYISFFPRCPNCGEIIPVPFVPCTHKCGCGNRWRTSRIEFSEEEGYQLPK